MAIQHSGQPVIAEPQIPAMNRPGVSGGSGAVQSIHKVVQTLRPLQQIGVTIAGHEHTAADPLTDTAREILAATGTEWPTH